MQSTMLVCVGCGLSRNAAVCDLDCVWTFFGKSDEPWICTASPWLIHLWNVLAWPWLTIFREVLCSQVCLREKVNNGFIWSVPNLPIRMPTIVIEKESTEMPIISAFHKQSSGGGCNYRMAPTSPQTCRNVRVHLNSQYWTRSIRAQRFKSPQYPEKKA